MCMYAPLSKKDAQKLKEVRVSLMTEVKKRRIALKCIKEVDALPQDFGAFLSMQFEKVMFYEKVDYREYGYNAKTYMGRCECGYETTLDRVRGEIKCPECGATVRMRNKRFGNYYHEKQAVAIIEKVAPYGWVQRLFATYKVSNANGTVQYQYFEEERDFMFNDGSIYPYHPIRDEWRYGDGRMHGMGWSGWRVSQLPMGMYLSNKAIFNDTEYQYCPFELASDARVMPFRLMRGYMQYPKQVEMLYKAGLNVLAEELIGIRSCNCREKLGNSKPRDLGMESKADIEYIKNKGFTSEQCFAWKEVKHWKIDEADLIKAIDFVKDLQSGYLRSTIYDFISNERLFNYCVKQMELNSEAYRSISVVSHDYGDYIDYARKLGWDLSDTMYQTPHNLRHMHDRALALIQIERNKAFDNGIRRIYETLHKMLELEKDGLCVLMPRSSKALINEGKAQKHCVGGYCERVAEGSSIILFLRRASAKKKAFFTIELKPNFELVQCRGQGNYDYRNNKEVVNFMESYLKKIKEKMKNEEKRLRVV